MKSAWTALAAVFLFPGSLSRAEDFYAVPGKGGAANPGTLTQPWGTLEEAVRAGHLSRLKGGGRILLGSGYHGQVRLEGENSERVVIEPMEGRQPKLGRLTIPKGSNWTVRGLEISPSCGGEAYPGNIVTFAEGGPSRDLVLENCFIHTTGDASAWDAKKWMEANSGVFMGRHGRNLTVRNNYVLNTRFGLSLCAYDSLCEGNVVSDFSGDGIRITRDGNTVQYNVIKNGYVGPEDGDKNHDDAIQCFLFNKGTGTVRDVIVRYNLILNQEEDRQPFSTTLQAIGFFDGPLVNFQVEGNVVAVKHWHGVSLYDARDCEIKNNVVFNPWGGRFTPWVMLGSKQNQARGNTVTGNFAHKFNFQADPSVTASNNETVTEEIFLRARKQVLEAIAEKFPPRHPVAGRGRLGR